MAVPKKNPIKDSLDFKNEKEFQRYLVVNKEFWIEDFFGGDWMLKEQDYLHELKRFGANKPRIDITLTNHKGDVVGIEVKNPIQLFNELSRSVSQLLSYQVIAEENGVNMTQLAIFTSRFDPILYKIVRRFNLPIRMFVINRDIHCEIK